VFSVVLTFLSFTLMVNCALSITGTGMLLFFCYGGWLAEVLVIVPVAIGFFFKVFFLF